jgi:curli biogenesis system outer membrane secretion channel CsgG
MAIDMRVVEVATGRVLVAQRIAGSAQSSQTSLGITPQFGNVSMPASFNSFKNTPMELAIRDCVERATASVVNNIPRQLFRHR